VRTPFITLIRKMSTKTSTDTERLLKPSTGRRLNEYFMKNLN